MRTLEQVRQEFLDAGCPAAEIEAGGFDTTCPVCGGQACVFRKEPNVEIYCEKNGCDRGAIADALYIRGRKGTAALAHDPAERPAAHQPTGRLLAARAPDLTRVEPFRWAWHRRLLIGYLNLLVGDEGIGKSTFIAWLIARLTRGQLPGDLEGQPAKVLIIGDEDSFDRVTVPRLMAANADFDLVRDLPVIDDQPLDINRDAGALRDLIQDERFTVVYFEQLLDNLNPNVDDYRTKEVRAAAGGLRRLADDLQIVALASLHTNKLSVGTFRQRTGGSVAFNQLSRSSLWLAEHPTDPDLRVLVRGKGNYSAAPVVPCTPASC